MGVIRSGWWWHSAWSYRCAAVQKKRGSGQARTPSSSLVSIVTHPKNSVRLPRVPVSTSVAQCPPDASDPAAADATGSDKRAPEDGPDVRQNRGPSQALRARVDLALWELDACAAILAAECGPAAGPARLVEARWAAARALLLEMCAAADPAPPAPGAPELRLAPESEGALLGLLVRKFGWAWVDQSCLKRQRPPTRPPEAAVHGSGCGSSQPPAGGPAGGSVDQQGGRRHG